MFKIATTSFAYQASTADGRTIKGTIEAPDMAAARMQLVSLNLNVLSIAAVTSARAGRRLSGEDFIAFNQQLAQLPRAGLPVERGLRLIADDLRKGRLADATRQIAADLESGEALPAAFEKRRAQFPPLYGRLIDAGIKANNLPAMLFNLGR